MDVDFIHAVVMLAISRGRHLTSAKVIIYLVVSGCRVAKATR